MGGGREKNVHVHSGIRTDEGQTVRTRVFFFRDGRSNLHRKKIRPRIFSREEGFAEKSFCQDNPDHGPCPNYQDMKRGLKGVEQTIVFFFSSLYPAGA